MGWTDIHKKNPDSRKRMALLISGLVTGIIFVTWFTIWREYQGEYRTEQTNADSISPIESMTSVFSDGYNRFKEQFNKGNDPFAEIGQKFQELASSTASTTVIEQATTTATTSEPIQSTTTTIE
jgi:hypothetical protein